MAKRRNAKKEKAARNKINARKFRKPTSRYSNRTKRWSNNNEEENKDKQSSETKSDDSSSSESTSTFKE